MLVIEKVQINIGGNFEFNLSEFQAGIYLLKATIKGESVTKKLLIHH